ncbi:hypothetical protein ES703_29783 [subsurface metagenome]
MNCDFAFVCDYAEVTGKINALGIGFDTIYAPKIPCKHPHFFLVIQLRASVTEAGEKKLEVRLIDEDGKDIIPTLRGKFIIPKPVAGTESIGRIAMGFKDVEFPRYGSYSLHAVVEGQEIVRVPLKVSPPPQKK